MSDTVLKYERLEKASRHRPSILSLLLSIMSVQRQRRALAKLDEHLLTDIGVTRSQALSESKKHPWDAPQHWLK